MGEYPGQKPKEGAEAASGKTSGRSRLAPAAAENTLLRGGASRQTGQPAREAAAGRTAEPGAERTGGEISGEFYLASRQAGLYAAHRAVRNPSDAEDAYHTAVAEVLHKLRTRPETVEKPAALTVTTAGRRALDINRRTSRIIPVDPSESPAFTQREAVGPKPEDAAVASDESRLLHSAVGRLAPRQRQVMQAVLNDQGVAEIAADLQITPSNVRSAINLAKSRLREILTEEGYTR